MNACAALHAVVTLGSAWITPELEALGSLRDIVLIGSLEGLSTQITKFLDSLT